MQKIICVLTLLFFAAMSDKKSSAQEILMSKHPAISVAGDWQVRVSGGVVGVHQGHFPGNYGIVKLQTPVTLDAAPAEIVAVKDESYESLPLFNADAAGWLKGERLRGVVAQEVSAPDYLDPDSVVVKSAPNGETFARGVDYELDTQWGTIGRLPNGKIGEATKVFVSYRHGLGRLDSIIVKIIDGNGRVSIRRGTAKINLPQPPQLRKDEFLLANIWVFGRMTKLTDDNIFPLPEDGGHFYPNPVAETLLPKTLAKLRSGALLKILAWGDSVTDGSFLPSPNDRWQNQFLARLQRQFPKAKIELVTEAWGGRNTQSYLDEPPGSPHNYRERVLAVRPDLIVSEFVNDAGLTPQQVEERYSGFLKDFKAIGAEWIIQTPHYVTPAWMGLDREKNIEADPRPYVAGLRVFAANHNVALSDAAAHWGRLYQQGIPYTTLLGNMVNHPDERGMKLFADALMEIFPLK